MQRLSEDLCFKTCDLYLASWLLTKNLRLWAVDRRDPGRVQFLLTPKPQAEDLTAYVEGLAVVNVSDFGRALRKLKRAIHSDQEDRR